MEIIPFSGRLIKRVLWRKRSGYNKLSPPATNKRNVKIARFGTGNNGGSSSKPPRPWRLRLAPKLRLVRLASPMKLWDRFKNAYMKMMVRLANSSGSSNSGNVFSGKRIPKARDHVPMAAYSREEFENRLILEIYKSMVASLELGYNK